MGETTEIGWTDATFNPWWGCSKVSPGCDNCYAEAFSKRTGHDLWEGKTHRFFGAKHWNEPIRWSPRRIFCASMADVFENDRELDLERRKLWRLIEVTPQHTWQLLTKRPEQVPALMPGTWLVHWPEHVWLGTTVEDQTRANLRMPRLAKVPGRPRRFVSAEPLLGPLDTDGWTVDWVIAGGESGPHHRPVDPEWVRHLRDQCVDFGVPFFFKQWGGRTPKAGGRELDGRTWDEVPA